MKVLITGALGNIGMNSIRSLLAAGHRVRCFDLKTRANEARAARLVERVEVVWGDIRSPEDVAAAVQDQDVAVHLSFIMPPTSEERTEWAREVNVDGTRNLLDAMKALSTPPKIIFSSSFTVFGDTQDSPPPRNTSDPVQPTDNYTHHKVECERMVQGSGLGWSIFRFGVAPPMSLGGFTSKVFDIPVATRVEFLHPRDAGLAVANAVDCPHVWGKILLVGGGPGCQIHYGDLIGRMLEAMGVGRLPDEAFGFASAYTDWLDTTESQALFNYQRHTFDDFVRETAAKLGPARYLVPLARPFIRRWLLKKSPYYRASRPGAVA